MVRFRGNNPQWVPRDFMDPATASEIEVYQTATGHWIIEHDRSSVIVGIIERIMAADAAETIVVL